VERPVLRAIVTGNDEGRAHQDLLEMFPRILSRYSNRTCDIVCNQKAQARLFNFLVSVTGVRGPDE